MNSLHSGYFKLALFALLLLMFPIFPGLTTHAQSTLAVAPPIVPDNLKAPSGEEPILKVLAKGVQIYTCTASTANPGGFEWTLKAPEAELFDAQGVKVGKHYAGPSWEASDGSKIVGEVKERADAPGGKAIPWLLLKVKSSEGNGLLSKVSSVQRVETVAGLAPAGADCTQARKDNEVRVDYSATYYFYSPVAVVSPAIPSTGQVGTINESNSAIFSIFIILGLVLIISLAGLLIRVVAFDKK